MADLGNQKIKDTYQFVLQTDLSGNLQNLTGGTPNPLIVNNNLRYLDGNQADGYVLLSDSSGNASWGPVAFSGDVYVTGGSINSTTIQLNVSSGGTVSIPGLSWSSSTSGHISNSGLTGNVGIGTPTPNKKLTVVGDISASTNVYSNNLVLKANAGGTDYGQITPDVNHGTIKFMTKPPGTADNGESLTISQDLIEAKAAPGTGLPVSYMQLLPVDGGQDKITFNEGNNDIDFIIKSDNEVAFKLDAAKDMMAFRDYVGISNSSDKWPTDTGGLAGTPKYQLRVIGQTLLSGITTPLEVMGNISGTTNLYIDDNMYSGTTNLLDIFASSGMSGTVTSVAISGTDGIDVDSGSPITDSGTITLGLSNVDATKIANGSVTNTEFQYINTLSSNAQTQLDAKLPLAGGTMAGAIAMGTNKITALGEGTDDSDAVTKGYVDTQDIGNRYWSATTTGGHIVNSGLTGNVGIGTDTPSALLDVKGTTNITQRLGVSGETAVGGAVHTSTSFVVGNATLTTSELDISSGNFTLDVEGDITLDANGADIILSDNGTDFGRFKRDTSDFVIKSETNNKDIVFKGQDGGSTITALTLDMSEAGKATFNSNVVSANEDVYMFSNRGQGQTDNTHWYGPNYQGIYNYSWSKDYGDDTEVLTLDEEYANAGLLVPYDCILTGFFTIGHTNSGTVGYSCGLWYVLATDLASSLNVTSGTAGDVTLTPGVSGTTVNPGNGKNPLTIDKRGTVSISLTAGSMIYPRVGDSAVVTDTTWNIYLKRT